MNANQAARLVEEGSEAMEPVGLMPPCPKPDPQRLDVIVIGAGQAGLAVG